MHDDDDTPEPEDERSLFERIGLPQLTSDMDQLKATLVGYADCINSVYARLLEGGFPEDRAQKMARDLWLRLVVPMEDGEEVYEP